MFVSMFVGTIAMISNPIPNFSGYTTHPIILTHKKIVRILVSSPRDLKVCMYVCTLYYILYAYIVEFSNLLLQFS